MAEKNATKAPRSCRTCPRWEKVKDKVRVSAVVRKAVKKVETKMKAQDFKPTLAEFLKLVQLDKDLGGEEPKEIQVTWVDPTKSEE
jgi:hypothetical protein